MIIRREAARISLIRQRDHALLSGALAAAMPMPPLDDLDCREELIDAIRRHDDGWQEWDATPKIDRGSGVPLGFDQMAPAESRKIWSASIESASQAGRLSGWVVAGHFVDLSERGGYDSDMFSWGDRMAWQQRAWMRHWLSRNLERRPKHARIALAFLQFFDSFSLVLCRSPDAKLFPLEHPQAGLLDIEFDTAQRALISPWPFDWPMLEVRIEAFELPAPVSTSEIDMGQLASITLAWTLEAKGSA